MLEYINFRSGTINWNQMFVCLSQRAAEASLRGLPKDQVVTQFPITSSPFPLSSMLMNPILTSLFGSIYVNEVLVCFFNLLPIQFADPTITVITTIIIHYISVT